MLNSKKIEIEIILEIEEDYLINNSIKYFSDFAKDSYMKYWVNKNKSINNSFIPNKIGTYEKSISFDFELKDCSRMFEECSDITNINFLNFDTSKITKMDEMFKLCWNLEELDLSSFNTKNVTDMKGMFDYCSNLTKINLSNFDTQNVVTMENLFCS